MVSENILAMAGLLKNDKSRDKTKDEKRNPAKTITTYSVICL